MPLEIRADDELIDPTVHCSECEAVCCRLRVIVGPEDPAPPALLTRNEEGLDEMARAADGWCVALERSAMRCGIYAARPDDCRRFTMGAGHCRAIREDYRRQSARVIAHVLVNAGSA